MSTTSRTQLQERPPVAPSADWQFPVTETWTLDDRMTGQHVTVPGCGLLDLTIHLDAPLSGEPVGREGLTDVLVRCLAEGASDDRDAAEFAAAMDEVGATFDTQVTPGGPQLKIGVPAAGAARALALVAALVRAPRFEAAEVERMVAHNLDAHAEMSAHAARRARAELCALAFAPDARIATPRAGTPVTVSGIDHHDVEGHWRSIAGPQRMRVVSAGDLTLDAIRTEVAAELGGWPSTETDPSPVPTPGVRPGGVRLVHRPGAVQTAITLGGATVDQRHLDHPSVLVGAYALGVPINSRLSLRLREEKGYTYGVHAFLQPDLGVGLFGVATQVERDVTVPALSDLLEIVQTFRTEGMGLEEHATAVEGLLGKDPIEFQTTERLVRQLADQEAYRLPAGWLTELRRRVAATTVEGCREAFDAHLPEELSLVLVGDADVIEPGLSAQGWDIEVVS